MTEGAGKWFDEANVAEKFEITKQEVFWYVIANAKKHNASSRCSCKSFIQYKKTRSRT